MNKLIRKNRLTKNELLVDETIFSLANGYIGTRGTFAEGYGTEYDYNQTYINAFYDNYEYKYEENLSGFPQLGQKTVNIIDGTKMEFLINNKAINMTNCEVVSLEREYDLEKGETKRIIHYKLEDYDFYLTEKRLVSSKYKGLIILNVNFESPNYQGIVQVKSYLRKSIQHKAKNSDPRLVTYNYEFNYIDIDPKRQTINVSTKYSNLCLLSSMQHSEDFGCYLFGNDLVATKYLKLDDNNPINLTKKVLYTTDLYSENMKKEHNDNLSKISKETYESLLIYNTEECSEFWDSSLIKIEGNKELENYLNYNIFQLNSSGGESEFHNIAAKGLSGEGYEGHYFWDTEIYMIPFFTLTNPKKAKNLLMFRYHKLKESRQEAVNLGYKKGVKIPWRTINGQETSPYYPAGSAQFHINSDVAFAVIKYFEATNDVDFLINYGFELLVETARFLEEAVNQVDGVYHLNSVTGPDEYTTVVDDNFYTNKMLKYHFEETCYLFEAYKEELSSTIQRLNILDDEIIEFNNIARNIDLPFDEELNIYIQDRNFLNKEKVNLEDIPEDNFPLLLHYHPLYLYKHQVLKQADTMLALMLLDFEDIKILEDSFNYYEPITTHDSSLSKCIYSIVAYKLNKMDLACDYFKKVLETDVLNTHKNTSHGLHVANLGGSYLGFVYGILGLRIHRGYLKLEPKINDQMREYSLKLMYQGSKVSITVGEKITVETTRNVTLMINNEFYEVDGVLTI